MLLFLLPLLVCTLIVLVINLIFVLSINLSYIRKRVLHHLDILKVNYAKVR